MPIIEEFIEIKGARENNLKDFDVRIPRDALVVITGLSGSGKSSLAFDTIYAESQRRYVESLSAYARVFLEKMGKPDVDNIEGLSPSIAIEQRSLGRNPRSTVGTTTEIYDHMRLLFARIGDPHCTKCHKPITSQTLDQMADRVLSLSRGSRIEIHAPIVRGRKGQYKKELDTFRSQGFSKVRIDGTYHDLRNEIELDRHSNHNISLVIDRLIIKDRIRSRVLESIQTAEKLTNGVVSLVTESKEDIILSTTNACLSCGISLPELTPSLFSFNSPQGMCPQCKGFGQTNALEPDLFITDPSLSIKEGAITPWSLGKHRKYYQDYLSALANSLKFELDIPWKKLSKRIQKALIYGTGNKKLKLTLKKGRRRYTVDRPFDGVFGDLKRQISSDPERARELSQFGRNVSCDSCNGTRLTPEPCAVTFGNKTINDLVNFPVSELKEFFTSFKLKKEDAPVGERLIKEITDRLQFLIDVGLSYLTLDRSSDSLSGGEAQRIRLATQIGANLMGVLYVLDEPSIGLHSRDQKMLLNSLKKLQASGNCVIVVEHDEATIRAADHILDMGPGAGKNGGEIVASGTLKEICSDNKSPTGLYLAGKKKILRAARKNKVKNKKLILSGCSENNLKGINLEIPLGSFISITGVSGSGKSTLVNDTLYRVLAQRLYSAKELPGKFTGIQGIEHIDKVIDVNQTPIGRTPRSNPATFTGLFSGIRDLFSQTSEARARGFGPGRFSFNVKGGRCEACQGDGSIKVEMHFLPDLFVSCEVCGGQRYNRETLEINYNGKNIAEILGMTASEAARFFENIPSIKRRLDTITNVGLGYIQLGQSATTLSGGEAQRIKLSRELAKRDTGKTVYILDEPTTGLHFSDISYLLKVLENLVELGNTVIVIEHHLDVIKNSDWIIDLGPEGGEEGGFIVEAGTPATLTKNSTGHTGIALASLS